MNEAVVLCGLGGATALGRSIWSSAAAVRAAVTGFGQHARMTDVEGRPVIVAACPWLDPATPVSRRLASLFTAAVHEAMQPLQFSEETSGTGLRLALLANLPHTRPGVTDGVIDDTKGALARTFSRTFAATAMAQQGHAGALMALKSAVAALRAGQFDACVVAAVDSYMDLETLEWLEDTEQLHGAGRRNNAWGFVPGEGAGALLLMRHETAARLDIETCGWIAAVSVAVEKNLIRSGMVCLGRGLTTAFTEVFMHLADDVKVTDTYCDMNGEPYRADEFGFAVTRTRERFVSPSDFVAPADCWGDVGAASGTLAVALAAIAVKKSYARGGVSLIWASSDTGERGATVVLS